MSAGKDTLADAFVEKHGYVHLKFADAVWDLLLAINPLIPITDHQIPEETVPMDWRCVRLRNLVAQHGRETVKRNYPEVRRLLQRTGTEGVRDTLGDWTWCEILGKKIRALNDNGINVVVSDVRFENETRLILNCGGSIVQIVRPSAVVTHSHSSESDLAEYNAPYVVHNDRSIAELKDYSASLDFFVTREMDQKREEWRKRDEEEMQRWREQEEDNEPFDTDYCEQCNDYHFFEGAEDFYGRCTACGQVAEWSFDRSVCPEPCGTMHYFSVCCGEVERGCYFVQKSTG
jgi:hypothetical protein